MSSTEASIKEWEDILPEWVIRKATPGLYEVGCNLPTRDGRRMGNAHIVKAEPDKLGLGRMYYTCLTDAGSTFVMNSSELAECFWPPKWVSDLNEILRKFDRNLEASVAVFHS